MTALKQAPRYSWDEVLEAKESYRKEAEAKRHSKYRADAIRELYLFDAYYLISVGKAEMKDYMKDESHTQYNQMKVKLNLTECRIEWYFKEKALGRNT